MTTFKLHSSESFTDKHFLRKKKESIAGNNSLSPTNTTICLLLAVRKNVKEGLNIGPNEQGSKYFASQLLTVTIQLTKNQDKTIEMVSASANCEKSSMY